MTARQWNAWWCGAKIWGGGDHFATPSIILKRKMGVGVASVAVEDTEQNGADDVVGTAATVASVVQRVFAEGVFPSPVSLEELEKRSAGPRE